MGNDLLEQHAALRKELERERERILERLRQVEAALGVEVTRTRGARRNEMSLREAVLRVTAKRPLTKEEIYDAVKRLGYRFTTKDPLNVIGVVVYGKKPRFRNDHGRFSPMSTPKGLTGGSGT